VLVIEDNRLVRDGLEDFLRAQPGASGFIMKDATVEDFLIGSHAR
jgi:DNA-binding NarL/FixJ family response regulator